MIHALQISDECVMALDDTLFNKKSEIIVRVENGGLLFRTIATGAAEAIVFCPKSPASSLQYDSQVLTITIFLSPNATVSRKANSMARRALQARYIPRWLARPTCHLFLHHVRVLLGCIYPTHSLPLVQNLALHKTRLLRDRLDRLLLGFDCRLIVFHLLA